MPNLEILLEEEKFATLRKKKFETVEVDLRYNLSFGGETILDKTPMLKWIAYWLGKSKCDGWIPGVEVNFFNIIGQIRYFSN